MKAIVGNKSSPLFIQLSESTIEYLKAVCHHQINAGGYKRQKNGASKRAAVDDAEKSVKVAKADNSLELKTSEQKIKLNSDALGKFKFSVRNRRRTDHGTTAASSSCTLAKYFKVESSSSGGGVKLSVTMDESATDGKP